MSTPFHHRSTAGIPACGAVRRRAAGIPGAIRRAVAAVSMLLLTCVGPALSQTAAPDKPWYEQLTLHGSVSSSFVYNLGTPADGINRFHAFDAVHNSLKIDCAELILQRPVEAAGEAGFRVDVIAGSSIPHLTASSGLLSGQDIDLKQAFISYTIPVGHGIRLDAGKYVTHFGYEVIEGFDGINDNMTRSFVFSYALPFAHVGVRGSYAFSDAVSAQLGVVNGWDVAVDNNSSKTVTGQIGLKPGGGLSLTFNGAYGPERAHDNSHNRSCGEFCATWTAGDHFTVGVNGCLASEQGAAVDGAPARWSGYAGYLRWQASDAFACAVRVEMFDDPDGVRTGFAQKLASLTVTPEYRPAVNLVLRADLRLDSSSEKTFLRKSDASDTQNIIGCNMMYLF